SVHPQPGRLRRTFLDPLPGVPAEMEHERLLVLDDDRPSSGQRLEGNRITCAVALAASTRLASPEIASVGGVRLTGRPCDGPWFGHSEPLMASASGQTRASRWSVVSNGTSNRAASSA